MISAEEFLSQHVLRIPDVDSTDAGVVANNTGISAADMSTVDEASIGGENGSDPSTRAFESSNGNRHTVNPDDIDECRETALRLLDAAPRSSGALRERLTGKGYAVDIVDTVIDRLVQVQLLDDQAYAESTVRNCVGRLMGRRGTVAELIRKGVDRSLAESVTGQAETQGMFEDAAWELGRRYIAKNAGRDMNVCKRRFWSAGGRKGHSSDTLRRVADELMC